MESYTPIKNKNSNAAEKRLIKMIVLGFIAVIFLGITFHNCNGDGNCYISQKPNLYSLFRLMMKKTLSKLKYLNKPKSKRRQKDKKSMNC